MDTDDATQSPAATPIPTPPTPGIPQDGNARPADRTPAPTGERVLDLVALLLLIALSAAVFAVAGPGAFTAVTSAGLGLFATWRSRR